MYDAKIVVAWDRGCGAGSVYSGRYGAGVGSGDDAYGIGVVKNVQQGYGSSSASETEAYETAVLDVFGLSVYPCRRMSIACTLLQVFRLARGPARECVERLGY